jgi:dipeptidyl aminopeptidase/acylaminoacyl peptidase
VISHIKQVEAPMLIVVGDRDVEYSAPQSFGMRHALRALGVPTSLVVYTNQNRGQSALDWSTLVERCL